MNSLRLYSVTDGSTDIYLRDVLDETEKFYPSYDVYLYEPAWTGDGGVPAPPPSGDMAPGTLLLDVMTGKNFIFVQSPIIISIN